MDDLSDFITCCRGLDSERVAERKRHVSILQRMLMKTQILRTLDSNTDNNARSKGHKTFDWHSVMKAVISFVAIETAVLEKTRQPASATAASNRDKKLQEVSHLFKVVAKVTDKRGPRLRLGPVIQHITQVIQNPVTCTAYGIDYSNVLLKQILCVHKYVTEMSPENWHYLIAAYLRLYRDPPPRYNRVFLSHIIHSLVAGAISHMDLRPKKLFTFLTQALHHDRQEKTAAVQEHLVSTMNLLVRRVAADSRRQVCRLGEDLTNSLVRLWRTQPSPNLKDGIVVFLLLQMQAHHPGGAKTEGDGAYAVDWDTWKSGLGKIYAAIYMDLVDICGRHKFSSGYKDVTLPSDYVELAADTCHQLFTHDASFVELTQMSSLDPLLSHSNHHHVETGWITLRSAICNASTTMGAIPWIQLLTRLIQKYPTCLPDDELSPLLTILLSILRDCKTDRVLSFTQTCLCVIADVARVPCTDRPHGPPLDPLVWNDIWTASLRLISVHLSCTESFTLLSRIVDRVTPTPLTWDLFLPNVATVSNESISFLLSYLSRHDLPEKYHSSTLLTNSRDDNGIKWPLREQLYDWLIPNREDYPENMARGPSFAQIDVRKLSVILVALTLRNYTSFIDGTTAKGCTQKSHLSHFETVYLSISFHLPLMNDDPPHAGVPRPDDSLHVPCLMQKLESLIGRDVQIFVNGTQGQVDSDEPVVHDMKAEATKLCSLDYGVELISLIVYIITHLLNCGAFTAPAVSHLDLTASLKALLKKFTSDLIDFSKKEGTVALNGVITSLARLVTTTCTTDHTPATIDQSVKQSIDILQSLMPGQLLDYLLDIALDTSEVKKPSGSDDLSDPPPSKRRRCTGPATVDDMSLDLDDVNDSTYNDDVTEMDFDDQSSQCTSDAAVRPSLVTTDQLSTLTTHQSLRLSAIKYLFQLSTHNPAISLIDIRHKILDLLRQEQFDPNRSMDLHILFTVGDIALNSNVDVTDALLQTILCDLRLVLKTHRRDQDICMRCVSVLASVCPFLVPSSDTPLSPQLAECRHITQSLFTALWRLKEDLVYIAPLRLKITQCMQEFLKIDIDEEWVAFTERPDPDPNATPEGSFCDEFISCLQDPSYTVRHYTADNIMCVFGDDTACLTDTRQTEIFVNLFDVLDESLNPQGRSSPDQLHDDKVSHSSTVLRSLATVMCRNATCEKRALFACLRSVHNDRIDIGPVLKVLGHVSSHLGYTDVTSYISSHLPYLIDQWLKAAFPIDTFIYELLGYSSILHFYSQHRNLIIPQLIIHDRCDAAISVARELNVEWPQLVRSCIPTLVTFILPVFAMNAADRDAKRFRHASLAYETVTDLLTKPVFEKSVADSLEEVVVNILMTLHDSEDHDPNHSRMCTKSEPNPPFYDARVVEQTLEYLVTHAESNATSHVALLIKNRDSIQNILLSLSLHLTECHRPPEIYRALLMYRLFVVSLLPHFPTDLGGSLKFVLRDVIHRLVLVMRDGCRGNTIHSRLKEAEYYGGKSQELCVELLEQVCSTSVAVCPQELGNYLPWIVCSLVSNVDSGQVMLSKKSIDLLDLLLVDNVSVLKSHIIAMDTLPERPALVKYRDLQSRLKYASGKFTLRQEMVHFLKTSHDLHLLPESRVEGLKLLASCIRSNQSEISELVKEAQYEGADSVLCRLVSELIHLSTCQCDVTNEISGCLGELGPLPLCAVSLPLPASRQRVTLSDTKPTTSQFRVYTDVFFRLKDYLIDDSIKAVQSTASVLKSMLATRSGVAFVQQYQELMGRNDNLFPYLHPFCSSKPTVPKGKKSTTASDASMNSVDDRSLWLPHDISHEAWVTHLVCGLLLSGNVRDDLLVLLEPICTIKAGLCEAVLPYIIHDVLANGDASTRLVLSNHIGAFFESRCQSYGVAKSSQVSNNSTNDGSPNASSVRVMLTVIQYLREQTRTDTDRSGTPFDNNFWLELDYLHVAQAALSCHAYIAAVLYTEIWYHSRPSLSPSEILEQPTGAKRHASRPHKHTSESPRSSQDVKMMCLTAETSYEGLTPQGILLEAFRNIGDPDGVYGYGAGHLSDVHSRTKTYEHEARWDKVLIARDIHQQDSVLSSDIGLALQHIGAFHVLERYLKSYSPRGPDMADDHLDDLRYECAWRMAKWDLPVPTRIPDSCSFNEAIYYSLAAVRDKHPQHDVTNILSTARCKVLSGLRGGGRDTIQSLYPVLGQLYTISSLLQPIHDLYTNSSDGSTRESAGELDTPTPALHALAEYSVIELSLAVKTSFLKVMMEIVPRETTRSALVHHLTRCSQLARENRRFQQAERLIHQLRLLDSITDASYEWRIEEACLYWSRGEEGVAKHLMGAVMTSLKYASTEHGRRLYPRALNIYGNWLAETRSDSPTVIMDDYLQRTVDLIEASGDDTGLDAYMSLGRYADAQYARIVDYMRSSTFESKQSLYQKSKEEATKFKGTDDEERVYLSKLAKQTNIDQTELECLNADKNLFLLRALENYAKCLRRGDRYDLRAYRVVSLWFENADSNEVNSLIDTALDTISSHKFCPLMYQLAARMTLRPQPMKAPLFKLIQRASLEHPHHTLYIVLALAHANKDKDFVAKTSGRQSANSNDLTEQDRVSAAKDMVDKLSTTNIRTVLRDKQRLCLAYIELANLNVAKHKAEKRPVPIPAHLLIHKMKDVHTCPVPTSLVPIDLSCEYKRITHISSFHTSFNLAGGINLPKIISCVGSDGKPYKQLVKGRDDLRQDAVMQQVFSTMNHLLQDNQATRRRKLHIRTYKVIPLSQRSGVLEWCEGTQPIGEYLISTHTRYHPRDWSAKRCRDFMMEARNKRSGKLLEAFQEICTNFRPVMRHFFFEKFLTPASWYEKRLAYTRSVATNSIVGYVLGLGDRHVQNILIDTNSAELIHIDLGVAFEQGRILPTPETVPFRLTRDIVDGMGIAGVEGVFRSCCEKTMDVMHQNHELLMTLLQVLLHDPLYAWSMSPQKAYKLQRRGGTQDLSWTAGDVVDQQSEAPTKSGEASGSVSKMAERVLLRLQQKLQGREDGIQLTVSAQVNHLIQEAKDPKNLSKLFPGWQPYI